MKVITTKITCSLFFFSRVNVPCLAPHSRPSEIRALPRLIFAELWFCRVCDQLAVVMLGLSLQHLSSVCLGTEATLTLFLLRCTAVSTRVAGDYDKISPSLLCIQVFSYHYQFNIVNSIYHLFPSQLALPLVPC